MFSNSLYSQDYLFYACMVSQCTVIFDEHFPASAGVSYNNCSYKLHINPIRFNEFSLIERLAVLKHEMLHILNGHLLYRNQEGYHDKWNIAYDCAINQLIDSDHLPDNCVTPEYLDKLTGKKVKRLESSEYYYELLKDVPESQIDPEYKESHESWDLSGEEPVETQKSITSDMIEDAKDLTLRSIGGYPSECSRWLSLHKSQYKINWKNLLKSYIKTTNRIKTIYTPNRRHPNRMDLKGTKKDKTFNLLYIIDASGSVKNSEFKELNSVIISLCNQFNLKITSIQVDSDASEPEILSKTTEMIERKRNAGTFLSKGLEKAEERKIKYDTVIVSTDGFLSVEDVNNFMKINKKVIFLVCKNGSTSIFENKKNIVSIKIE